MATTPAPIVPDATRLAVDRTRLAHERTLMAWIRTATSLISFGFATYKFFEYLREQGTRVPADRLIGPREFALIMIGIGLTALGLATAGHYRSMQTLRTEYGSLVPNSLATILAILVGALGVLLLLAVALRQ